MIMGPLIGRQDAHCLLVYYTSYLVVLALLVAVVDTNRRFCEDKPPVLLQIDKREATEAVPPLLF